MNLFEQYGIKEVADVTIYSIHKKTDGSGDVYYVPALYLDTLKVSTVEKTGESTWALGGLGNSRLINWDYGKTINVTLEDALCTPASLGMCWNGTLSADWKDAHVDYNSDVCVCRNPLVRISRMEKAIYPSGDRKTVSRLLPLTPDDSRSIDDLELLRISSIVDGTKINGVGMVGSKTYNWKMAIESAVKSIAVVPDRFFDIKGRSYSIDWNRKISADNLPSYNNYKSAVIYRINTTSNFVVPPIAEIIFDNEMQNRCGKELNIKIYFNTESGETKYIRKDFVEISNKETMPRGWDEDGEGNEIYKETKVFYKLDEDAIPEGTSAEDYDLIITIQDYNTTVNDDVREFYIEVKEYEYIGKDNTPIEELPDEQALRKLYKEIANIQPGKYNVYDLLTKQKYLFDKGFIIGAVENNVCTPDPTKDLEANKVHFILCPKDRIVEIDENPSVSLRVFTLNDYGITKYLNGDKGNLVTDLNAWKALEKYLLNHATTNMFKYDDDSHDTDNTLSSDEEGNSISYIPDTYDGIDKITATEDLENGNYLAIIIDANNNYHALVGLVEEETNETTTEETDVLSSAEDKYAQRKVIWYKPSVDVDVTQFQGIDMWLRFESVNEMIYFLITKYEQDIQEIRSALICPKDEDKDGNWDVNRNRTALHMSTKKEDKKEEGALWAYANPRTMQPYSDEYWFHLGDPYYVKSLTLALDGKKIKGNQIIVKADEWPGMYMVVGETRIRNRDTGEDERVQLKFPQCKVKADLTLTLSADGDPTTFTINLEVAKPRNGHMMEITAYEIATKMTEGENGCYYAIDGSSKVVTE